MTYTGTIRDCRKIFDGIIKKKKKKVLAFTLGGAGLTGTVLETLGAVFTTVCVEQGPK